MPRAERHRIHGPYPRPARLAGPTSAAGPDFFSALRWVAVKRRLVNPSRAQNCSTVSLSVGDPIELVSMVLTLGDAPDATGTLRAVYGPFPPQAVVVPCFSTGNAGKHHRGVRPAIGCRRRGVAPARICGGTGVGRDTAPGKWLYRSRMSWPRLTATGYPLAGGGSRRASLSRWGRAPRWVAVKRRLVNPSRAQNSRLPHFPLGDPIELVSMVKER